ncbi:MAG: hypothetical protein LBT81_00970 [Helicobacteraceae bacterium]|jgi:hypothetical protein|nr:hypothetical protein [Helicobacteraceae bacterium]
MKKIIAVLLVLTAGFAFDECAYKPCLEAYSGGEDKEAARRAALKENLNSAEARENRPFTRAVLNDFKNGEQFSAQAEREEYAVNKTIEVELTNGVLQISLYDLERIKYELLKVLKQQTPTEDYAYLIEELDKYSAPMITTGGVGRIGGWRLKVQDKIASLERQQTPRAPLMRFYEARLEVENGRWRVSGIRIVSVWGRSGLYGNWR